MTRLPGWELRTYLRSVGAGRACVPFQPVPPRSGAFGVCWMSLVPYHCSRASAVSDPRFSVWLRLEVPGVVEHGDAVAITKHRQTDERDDQQAAGAVPPRVAPRQTQRRAPREAGSRSRSAIRAWPAAAVWSASVPSRRNTTRSAQPACRASCVTSTPAAPASQRAAQQPQHVLAGVRVERAGRLVGEDQPRGRRRWPGRSRPAAAGRRTCRRGSGRPGRADRPRRAPPRPRARARRARDAVELARQHDVLERGQRGQQVEALEDVADASATDLRERGRLSPPSRCPSTTTSPDVGESRPPARLSRVDLPDPDGPMTATSSPAADD